MCDLCRQNPCPHSCPNYTLPNAAHYCSVCGDAIIDGEEFIENDFGEYRHWECFGGMRDLLEWLGYRIHTMEENCERNY